MDAPDFDELEWMVQQEYHFDEQAEFVEEETEGEPSHQSPSANHTGLLTNLDPVVSQFAV